jgi:copper chaperone CopZ
MTTVGLTITGMSCGHCVGRVTKALASVPGVTVKQVTVGHATVEYDGQPQTLASLVQAIDDAGYQAQPEAA